MDTLRGIRRLRRRVRIGVPNPSLTSVSDGGGDRDGSIAWA